MDEKFFLSLILSLFFAALPTKAALSPGLPEAMRFYKSPESKFPSGQASRIELEKNLVSQQTQADYIATWSGKDYRLEAADLLKETQLLTTAKTSRMTLMRTEAHTGAKLVASIRFDEKIMILESRNFWAYGLCVSCQTKTTGWISWSDLEAVSEDAGYAMNFIDTFLRSKPTYESEPLTTIPKGNLFKEWKINKGWLEISYKSKTGFVDLNHMSLRADFAKWAFHKTMGWLKIKNREGVSLRTEDGLLIPLENWNGTIGDSHKGMVLQSISNGPQIRSMVLLKKMDGQQWRSSQMPGHGLVWWNKSAEDVKETSSSQASTLTNTQILEKDIFSFAFMNGVHPKGLISAGAIYKSDDGLRWKKLSAFANQDEPVAIIPGLGWFVGSFRSTDEGKNFEPYIRWDRMTESIINKFEKAPLFLKILKIESSKNKILHVTVDAGFRKIVLATNPNHESWDVVK